MHGEIYIEITDGYVEAVYAENGEPIRYYRFDGEIAGNIYRGKVVKIADSGAFLDIGREKHAFLPKRSGLKSGDYLTVMTEREETGSKGCLLTEKLSVSGKFVIITLSDDVRFSRKISEKRRMELSSVFSQKGVIFRTSCEYAEKGEISTEIEKLKNELASVIEMGKNLYRTSLLRAIDPIEIAYNLYPDSEVIVGLDKIRKRLDALTARKVEEDGVELVFDKTEAMTVIDVNSHRFSVGFANEEDASLSVNLTAATFIARQIRLRNIGGLIAVDFVSMRERENIEKLKKRLSEALKFDDVMCRTEFIDSMCIAVIARKKRYSSI